jgi:tetratricopeptide (TPR) repeat protein
MKKSKKNEIPYAKPEKYKYVILLLLVLVPLGVYWYSTGLGLSGFDDDVILSNARQINGIQDYQEAFKRDAFLKYGSGDFYRPLQSLSYLLDSSIGDFDNFYFHLSNLILHIIFCLLLYVLLLKLNIERTLSFAFALIYSVHPFFVHTVVWIPSRGDLFLAIFVVTSCIFYIKFLKKQNYLYLILNVLSFFLAIFSKETAVVAIAVFALYYFLQTGKQLSFFFKPKFFISFFLWIAVVLFYLWFRGKMIGFNPAESNVLLSNFIMNLATIPEFFGKFIFPVNLSPMPETTTLVTALGIIALFASLIGLALIKESNKSLYFVGIIWFLLFTIPPMFYRQSADEFTYTYLEHRAYLPSVGLLMMILALIPMDLIRKNRKVLLPVFCLLIAGFAYYTNVHGRIYDSPIKFYSYIIDKSDNILSAYNNRGNYLMRQGRHKEALQDYNKALSQNPNAFNILNNRANCYTTIGLLDSAMLDYQKAIKINPNAVQIRTNYAILLQRNNMYEESLEQLNIVLNTNPNYTQAYGARGLTYGKLKKPELAVKDFDRALEFYKHSPFTFYNRGVVKYDMNDFQGALADFNEALKLKNDYAEALYYRGVTNIKIAKNDIAMDDLNKALELREFYPEAYFNRGVLYGIFKEYSKAINDFNVALEQRYDSTLALRQRGKAFYAYGDTDKACRDWLISLQKGDSASNYFYSRACLNKKMAQR